MCLHIGSGFGVLNLAPNAPIDNLMVLACQISTITAQDLLWGPAFRNFPKLRVAFSEGGIGWIPFFLDRSDRHYTNQKWTRQDFGGKLPSEVFRERFLTCFISDDLGIDLLVRRSESGHVGVHVADVHGGDGDAPRRQLRPDRIGHRPSGRLGSRIAPHFG